MDRKILFVPIVALTMFSGTFLAVPLAHAQGNNQTVHENFFQGLVDFLAQKFNLDKQEVKNAITDYHKQKMQDREKERLDKLVSQGKITSVQEQAILNELATLRSKYNPDSFNKMTPEQRKTQMEAMQNELKTWAQTQGIDVSYVLPHPFMRGFGKKWMGTHTNQWESKPDTSPTPTPTQ